MTKKLAIVPSSFALVETLNTLARQMLPDVGLITLVDDSLLTYARQNGVDDVLLGRIGAYFRAAGEGGADAIINVCSSVGETVDDMSASIPIPILKIDEPMAEAAVAQGTRIAVLATVESTLEPTCRLLQSKARTAHREVELSPTLCQGAFEALMAGQTEVHDRAVIEAVLASARDHDVIVLAQASMARIAPLVQDQVAVPVLSSPTLAMQRLAQMLA